MSESPPGVPAAPNRFEIRAEILDASPSPNFPGKWDLSVRLIEARHLSGPDVVTRKVGTRVDGFTFDPPLKLESGRTIAAKAEYLGDSRHGFLQLAEIVPGRSKHVV